MTNSDAIKWIDSLREAIGDPLNGTLWHYEQPLAEIIDLLKKQYWTSCSKELPEKKGCYLVTVDEYDRKDVNADFFYIREDGTPSWHVEKNIIAWMPFPEPWEGEQDE